MRRLSFSKVLAVAAITVLGFCFTAQAVEKPDNYPKRPVTVIVPFGAGGGADQMARALLQEVGKNIGVPIIVVNKPGGNATLGFYDYWAAPEDGYTLLQYNDDGVTHKVSSILKQDPTVDYQPLSIAMIVYSQIYIRGNDKRFHDWDSFIAYAKANPGKVTLGNIAQKGNLEEVQATQLMKAAGVEFRQISFDKPSERYASLVGGHVDALLEQPGDVSPYIKSGDMKPILSYTDVRPVEFQDIPCIKELDDKVVNIYKVRGFYCRPTLDKKIQDYLREAFKQAFLSENFQKYISDKYLVDTEYRDLDQSIELLRGMMETYAKTYRELGYIK